MTEKEKMLTGKLYFAGVEELTRERHRARELTKMYNSLDADDYKTKNNIISELFSQVGRNCFIEQPFRCDYGSNISVGDNFYSNFNLVILDCAKIKIGNNVFIAPNVSLYGAGHPIDYTLRNSLQEYGFPIIIGDNVWIGGSTVINPGVTIGDNVVIGSGSVVTKDIPSGVIAVGNPCRVLREIDDRDKKYYFKRLEIYE